MKKHVYALILLIVLLSGCSNQTQQKTVITVSSASSLSDVLQDAATQFQAEHPTINIQFNFGASGSLKEQIEQGAPVDLFLSASSEKYEELVNEQLIDNSVNLASNEIVLITSVKSTVNLHEFSDLVHDDIEKIAIGTPTVVPAGTYGKQALDYYDVWTSIENKIVYAKDVRQVLTYVETNNAQAGIVYKTDALSSDKVRIVNTAGESSHDAIFYPAGVVNSTKAPKEASLFLQYIQSEDVQHIWEQYGFQME